MLATITFQCNPDDYNFDDCNHGEDRQTYMLNCIAAMCRGRADFPDKVRIALQDGDSRMTMQVPKEL